jgi:RHS repeat-associated protein
MVSEAFGKTFVDTTLAPTITSTTTNNLRFPGQYEDQETGTHYNFMRTYLPMVGRYGESDPIGLTAGTNTFQYADGNSVNEVDPTGEIIPIVAYVIGGVVAGGIDVALQLMRNDGEVDCIDWTSVGLSVATGWNVGGRLGYKLTLGNLKSKVVSMTKEEAYALRAQTRKNYRLLPVIDRIVERVLPSTPIGQIANPVASFARSNKYWDVAAFAPAVLRFEWKVAEAIREPCKKNCKGE